MVTSSLTSLPPATLSPARLSIVAAAQPERTISVLVDDFRPRPGPDDPADFFNRLNGGRGSLNNSALTWGDGQATTTVAAGSLWGGGWMSLSHPVYEGLPINFSAALPAPIKPAYQSQISGITVQIAQGTPGRRFRLELKGPAALRWSGEVILVGGPQTVHFDFDPQALGDVSQLIWVIDDAADGASVTLERVSLTATTPIADIATAAFVWSYAMLLSNWSPATGLVRDKATQASGAFDAIQATGSLAAATAMAEQLGVVGHADAVRIVGRIGQALLLETPRLHGLWPHFVKVSPAGEIAIAAGSEWSSVDTVIAAVGLLTAQGALGMDTAGSEQMLRGIDWADLAGPDGMLSHGYSEGGGRLATPWDAFGGESWLVDLAYAGATGQIAPLAYPGPPTANGSGFIDELAWLFVAPPRAGDAWGTAWPAYRADAAAAQVAYMPAAHPGSCLAQLGLFGLSAAEVPDPAATPAAAYQAFGVGGRFAAANDDGWGLLGAPVVAPHAAALVASLRPQAAIGMWGWLIGSGLFTPLTNVESLTFPAGCQADAAVWNHLKGSWNLALQALGWGRYLAERAGQTPALWRAAAASPLLGRGHALLAPEPTTVVYLPLVAAGL